MTDEKRSAITPDVFEAPAVTYVVRDEYPLVLRTNDAFESVFDANATEGVLPALFDRFEIVQPSNGEEPLRSLARGDGQSLYLDRHGEEGPYVGLAIPTGDETGCLVLSDVNRFPTERDTLSLNQVSSVISHDLRNPLDVAKANLRAARESGDSQYFDAVANAHDRMEQIIQDVLTITRERTVADPAEDVEIEPTAKAAWGSVDTGQASLHLTDDLPTITADADRLQRLFENLFRNSIDHGARDGRSGDRGQVSGYDDGIRIEVGSIDNGFYVADDGGGIAPSEQDHVFEPGYSTQDGGTGLGLAIVERIVAAHGWTITLRTAEQGGARFDIRFEGG